jgi:2-dehydro-3-deoxyphosphogalactonate aldolase
MTHSVKSHIHTTNQDQTVTSAQSKPQLPSLPLVAILRGLEPTRALEVAQALFDAGFRILEVPLNRPGALESIALIAAKAPADALIGAGTVLTVADVEAVHAVGGRLIVSPNCDTEVIQRAVALNMVCAPGIVTPTEAFTALKAGAHALKLFPAESVGPAGCKALLSVLPKGVDLWPVGGITPQSMAAWRQAGATGFGIGSQLFKPDMATAEVAQVAREFVAAWAALG